MIKPKKLAIGDTVGVISPSGCGGHLFPHRLQRGVAALEKLGFSVIEFPTVSKSYEGSAGTPAERARDIHEAFVNDEVKAIIAVTGGLSLNEVLPLLDYDLIAKHPKIFCGYSDNTLLHCALSTKTNIVSFYGPCVLTQFAEYPEPFKYTVTDFITALSGHGVRRMMPSHEWTDEVLDWFQKLDLTRPRHTRRTGDGHKWLRVGHVKALVTGGCLYSLLQVKGTEFEPDYREKVLFLDIPESEDNFAAGQALPYVSSQLADLELCGVFSKISGLIIGRPFGYTDEQRQEFEEIVTKRVSRYDFPVLLNANIGHADPIVTLPLNIMIELNSQENSFCLLESGVTE